ncbi:MAG TPA: aldehyde dehydrogenase family protein, partial [Steroidobacteraceae bacterium]|nr:aldehyde dehydrogenase family protein [Steroidobacteraceae bacterium]
MRDILASLGISETNSGAWSQDGGWSKDTTGPLIESINPTTGELIARVRSATAADYEHVIVSARKAFEQWRMVPAPKRGEAVRLIGEELRAHKSA